MPSKSSASELSIRDVFYNAQYSIRNHQSLSKVLQQKYENEKESFCEDFFECMKYILVQDEKSPVVERTVDFVAKFCADVNDDGEEEMNDLLKAVFNFLLEYHEAKNQAVRLRVCHMVDRIMNSLGQTELDVTICERIMECMLHRILDKVASIRAEAVKALYRLQEPEDPDCPVIKAFIYHMGKDPSAEVRTNVLRSIALNQITVPHIMKRILDVRETVRCAAYKTLSRINLRSFSIVQRELLLSQGLRDRFDSVKNCVIKELLNTWFSNTNKNFIEFLSLLDVESTSKTCELALNVLFEQEPLSEAVNGVPLDSVTHLVPHEKLNVSVAFFWRSLVIYIHKQAPEDLENIVPELTHFCSYIASLMKSKEREQWEDHQKEFILKQLLDIIPVFDLADEAGRCNLRELLLDLLLNDEVQVSLVPVIVSLLCEAIPDTCTRFQTLAEIVSEMHEPLTVVCSEMSSEDVRKKEIKRAELCVKLFKQEEIQQAAIKRQDFMEAEAMKSEIQTLKKTIDELTTQPDVVTQEVRQVKNDPFTLTKCLTIVTEMMQSPHMKGLTPQLHSLLDNFVLVNLEVPDMDVLNGRMRTLANYSIWDVELAKKYMNLFMFYFNSDARECEEIYLTVVKAIFDLFLVHGLTTFEVDADIGEVSLKMGRRGFHKANSSILDTTSVLDTTAAAVSKGDFVIGPDSCRNLLSKLCSLLNTTGGEIRRTIAEGLCKLLITGRVASSKILSHLLILWFNPVTEQDPGVRQMLGCFLELFSTRASEAVELLEEAFLPVITIILDAPDGSPLAEVDENEVVSLLINVMKSSGPVNVHNILAIRLCNEVLKNPENYYNKVYLKTLVNLSLSLDDVARENMKSLAEQLHKVIVEKAMLHYVKKFEQMLDRGPDSEQKEINAELNGNAGHLTANGLLSLSDGSGDEESEEDSKRRKTRHNVGGTTTAKRKQNKIPASPKDAMRRDVCRPLSLDSESADLSRVEETPVKCDLPVAEECGLSSKKGSEDSPGEVKNKNVYSNSGTKDENSDELKSARKENNLEKTKSAIKSARGRGRGRGRKAAVVTKSAGLMSVPRKFRSTRSTVCEETPEQKPPSPEPQESIAKSRPRRNVKVSVLQTFDDSTDELLATPTSEKKNVVVSETSSESEYSCSDDDDTDSDEVFKSKTPKPRKQSKVDKHMETLQDDFKKLGK